MGWHTFLDMLEAALRREAPQPREALMKRNAACCGVDPARPVRRRGQWEFILNPTPHPSTPAIAFRIDVP